MYTKAFKILPICAGSLLGIVIGFAFVGEVAQSDVQSVEKSVAVAQPTQGHLIKLSQSLPNAQGGDAIDPLDPAVIRRLRDAQPAAGGPAAMTSQEALIDRSRAEQATSVSPIYSLHLASVSDPDAVNETIETLRFDSSGQLMGAQFEAVDSVSVNGTAGFTRILAGSFNSLLMAEEACAILRQDGQYCSVLERLDD